MAPHKPRSAQCTRPCYIYCSGALLVLPVLSGWRRYGCWPFSLRQVAPSGADGLLLPAAVATATRRCLLAACLQNGLTTTVHSSTVASCQ